MTAENHYQTLRLSSQATQAEIKQAYRQLVKLFHPDSNPQTSDREQILRINAAYEVLRDPHKRQSYDQSLHRRHPPLTERQQERQQRTATAQKQYRAQRQQESHPDEAHQRWLTQVYSPVNRLLCSILNSLEDQLEQLAADPFDDELMADFQNYLADCRRNLKQAQQTFRSQPNPKTTAGAALHLYYCLNQVGDGIEELQLFTLNYDEGYLHAGQEMFRIAIGLHCEAREAVRSVAC